MDEGRRVHEFEAKLARLAQRWSGDRDLAAAYLFGSRARGDARPRSDVDLAVILHPGLSPAQRWRKRLGLLDEAASQLASDAVDLLVLEEAPPVVAHRALRDGRLIVDRIPGRRVEVVESVLRSYLDQAWLRTELDAGLRSRLREGRFAR